MVSILCLLLSTFLILPLLPLVIERFFFFATSLVQPDDQTRVRCSLGKGRTVSEGRTFCFFFCFCLYLCLCFCEGCLVVRSGHGPQAEVAQGVGPGPLVEL